MKKITTNSELEDSKYYWLCSKMIYDNGKKSDTKVISRFTRWDDAPEGEESRAFFEGRTWAMDSNNQALEKFDIYGPISEPDVEALAV